MVLFSVCEHSSVVKDIILNMQESEFLNCDTPTNSF
jgi:hypothetical protein